MRFNIFEQQYDEPGIRIFPFQQVQHLNRRLVLLIHPGHPKLSEVKQSAKELAASFQARLIVIRSHNPAYLNQPFLEMYQD